MYTAEQIKPKRYPEEKPSERNKYWGIDTRGSIAYWYKPSFNMFPGVDGSFTWFIDIPGAPPELKPLPYPQNKPSEDGEYWVHHVEDDYWYRYHYISDSMLVQYSWDDGIVDYFIPYRLDRKEKEMEKLLYDENHVQMFITRHGDAELMIDDDSLIFDPITFDRICREYLSYKGYDVVNKIQHYKELNQLEQIAELIDEAKGYSDDFDILDYADLVNNIAMIVSDVVKREPTLDKENEMDVIWETDELEVVIDSDGDATFTPHPMCNISSISISPDELTAFAQHWLDLHGYFTVNLKDATVRVFWKAEATMSSSANLN